MDCPTCDGAGELFTDVADHRGEHITVESPCPDCQHAYDGERDDVDDVDNNAECEWEVAL